MCEKKIRRGKKKKIRQKEEEKKKKKKEQSNLNFHFHTLQPDAQTIKKKGHGREPDGRASAGPPSPSCDPEDKIYLSVVSL